MEAKKEEPGTMTEMAEAEQGIQRGKQERRRKQGARQAGIGMLGTSETYISLMWRKHKVGIRPG